MSLFHLVFIVLIIAVGFMAGNLRNLTEPANPLSPGGFAPFGARGVLNGAAAVYFSYIGYDSVATLAEEVKDPHKNMPIGICACVLIVTLLYCLMTGSLAMVLPYDEIDLNAPFAMAFRKDAGWNWASAVVGMGASVGILSSLLVALIGQARYVCVIGRAHVIPSWLAKVNDSTGTPLIASVFLGICTAIIALFTELAILVDLISIGTLFVFYMVSNALLFRRHVLIGETSPWPTIAFLVAFSATSVAFVTVWHLTGENFVALIMWGVALLVLPMTFWASVPTVHRPRRWEAPLMPWLASLSIFLNIFLMSSVNRHAYIRFGVWSAGAVAFYMAYSVHATHDAEANASIRTTQAMLLEMQPLNDE
eukprot:c18675_g1_i4 orf=289-1383(-)